MNEIEVEIALWSNHVLDYLERIRRKHPNTTYWLRKREDSRLSKGFWFQGSNYISVSPYRHGAKVARIKSISLIVEINVRTFQIKTYLQIENRYETDPKIISFYKELTNNNLLGLSPANKHFRKAYSSNVEEALNDFWSNDKPIIDNLIRKYSLEKSFFIEEQSFKIELERIKLLRNKRLELLPDDDLELRGYMEAKTKAVLKRHKQFEKVRNKKFVVDYKKKNINIDKCDGCDLNPAINYGLNAIDFFELHHIVPFSEILKEKEIMESDVALLCPNCHRGIHKIMSKNQTEVIDIEKFKAVLQKNMNNIN